MTRLTGDQPKQQFVSGADVEFLTVMLGNNLPDTDEWTLSLITKPTTKCSP